MLDALQNLFENNVISEDIKESIERAWDERITENRNQIAQELREEFAQRYEHDKGVMVEAVDRMLGDQLKEEIQQFIEDRQQLAEAKAKYAVKMKKDAKLVKEFVTRQLASEVRDLHEDQVKTASKFIKLEKFVVEALAQEIAEFHVDKQDTANTKVKLVREGKIQLAKLKEQFIKRAAKLVETTVEKSLKKEISQLREDINAARKNDFGRKLFEAFATEFQTSYINEKSETAKLLKVIDKKEMEFAEAKHAVARAQHVLESKEAQIRALVEGKERQTVMNELLAPLASGQKAIMSELLESVNTSKLRQSFERYLPSVINGENVQRKATLTESKEVTGNKKPASVGSSESDDNIINIRRLAGI